MTSTWVPSAYAGWAGSAGVSGSGCVEASTGVIILAQRESRGPPAALLREKRPRGRRSSICARMAAMRPENLYEIHTDDVDLGTPVLVHALSGFLDAGAARQLAVAHLLDTLEHRTIGSFDIDAIYDYRARRPRMVFDTDHYDSLQWPELLLTEVKDRQGTGFLLLHGPEPDFAWQTFCAAVVQIVERFERTPLHRAERDPVAGAAHAARRRHGARHRPVAGVGSPDLRRRHRGARPPRRRGRDRARRGRARGDGLRGARAALPDPGRVPARRARAARGGRDRRRPATST